MSYIAQARLTEDNFLLDRVAGCVAGHGIRDAKLWAVQNAWLLSAQPGWAAAYDTAMRSEEPVELAAWSGTAGADPDVITDEMIQAGVEAVLAAEAPAPPAEPDA